MYSDGIRGVLDGYSTYAKNRGVMVNPIPFEAFVTADGKRMQAFFGGLAPFLLGHNPPEMGQAGAMLLDRVLQNTTNAPMLVEQCRPEHIFWSSTSKDLFHVADVIANGDKSNTSWVDLNHVVQHAVADGMDREIILALWGVTSP